MLERDPRKQECCWPRPLVIESAVRGKMLANSNGAAAEFLGFRAGDLADFHIDKSGLHARPAPWSPEPRDVSDYEYGRLPKAWMDLCPKRDRWFIAARSAKPQWSWAQIADQERQREDEVKGRYRDALKTILKRVARGI